LRFVRNANPPDRATMFKPTCIALVLAAVLPAAGAAEPLHADEWRWIRAGMPVIREARAHGLPLDIVVQPDDQPDASPIAIGLGDGRCKLVVSLRGNPEAKSLADSIPAGLFEAAAEAVFAHEVGHCWRSTHGGWNGVEAAAVDASADAAVPSRQRRAMRDTQLEEGYADLVGLAWIRRHRPTDYAAVHAWLERYRADDVDGRHHDTHAWLRLARDPADLVEEGDLFESVRPLWEAGSRDGEASAASAPSVSSR
jgi:hypothetical protein